jgi:hypothetical protein
VTFCEWLVEPFVPVMVRVYVPVGPFLSVLIVRVDEAEPLAGTATT